MCKGVVMNSKVVLSIGMGCMLLCGTMFCGNEKTGVADQTAVATKKGESGVHELNSVSQIFDAIDKHELVIVKFGAPWCPHCVRMEPELVSAAGGFDNVYFITVNMDKIPVADRSHTLIADVTAFPTLKVFKHGKSVGSLLGYANARKIKEFVENHK